MFEDREIPLQIDIPTRREWLDGREVTIASVADAPGEEVSPAGANPYGFASTTSLAAGALYLGSAVSEGDLLSLGLSRGFCNLSSEAALSGGVSQEDLLRLLAHSDSPGQAQRGHSLEDLAQTIESGSKVIAFVNAGELWDQADGPGLSEANRAVVIEGVARDAQSQQICGFLVRDPATPGRPAFADSARTTRMWLDTGGWQIVPSHLEV